MKAAPVTDTDVLKDVVHKDSEIKSMTKQRNQTFTVTAVIRPAGRPHMFSFMQTAQEHIHTNEFRGMWSDVRRRLGKQNWFHYVKRNSLNICCESRSVCVRRRTVSTLVIEVQPNKLEWNEQKNEWHVSRNIYVGSPDRAMCCHTAGLWAACLAWKIPSQLFWTCQSWIYLSTDGFLLDEGNTPTHTLKIRLPAGVFTGKQEQVLARIPWKY